MSPKRPTNDYPGNAPAHERRATRRSRGSRNDRQSRDEAVAVAYRVPRHRWPECWLRLHSRGATFTTTACHWRPFGGSFVDVLVRSADVSLVADLAQRLPAAEPDPWPAPRLRARAAALLWRDLGDVGQLPTPPSDWEAPV